MKNTFVTLTTAVLFAFPVVTFASTYQYVDVNGNMATVSANSAQQALTASNIAPNSGVMLLSNSNSPMTTSTQAVSGSTFLYVNTGGNISSVTAINANAALAVSNIAPTSGVQLVK